MARPETRAEILKFSPTGKCPALIDGEIVVWESLAIIEYLAESFPELAIWPRDKRARAHARSLVQRDARRLPGAPQPLPDAVPAAGAQNRADPGGRGRRRAHRGGLGARRGRAFGAGGPFLFGAFCAADAMFAPVVNRFHTYDVEVERADARLYGGGHGAARPGKRGLPARRGSRGASTITTASEALRGPRRPRQLAVRRTHGHRGRAGPQARGTDFYHTAMVATWPTFSRRAGGGVPRR